MLELPTEVPKGLLVTFRDCLRRLLWEPSYIPIQRQEAVSLVYVG